MLKQQVFYICIWYIEGDDETEDLEQWLDDILD